MERFVHCRECDKRINIKDAIVDLTEDIGIVDSSSRAYTCIKCHKYIVKYEHNQRRQMELNNEITF